MLPSSSRAFAHVVELHSVAGGRFIAFCSSIAQFVATHAASAVPPATATTRTRTSASAKATVCFMVSSLSPAVSVLHGRKAFKTLLTRAGLGRKVCSPIRSDSRRQSRMQQQRGISRPRTPGQRLAGERRNCELTPAPELRQRLRGLIETSAPHETRSIWMMSPGR
jgi:hypothetical protein